MAGKIYRYLSDDHVRLDDALQRATRKADVIDIGAYSEFREGLLRHIGMEEKILLPAARAANGGKPLRDASRLHLDHGALAALLVPTPTSSIIAAIKTILDAHNPVEEGPGGVYDECERLLASDADEVAARLHNARPVEVAPHVDSAIAFDSARTALHKAGYNLDIGR
jgi:hypothetical protein